tara:strand:+ start:22278 stop:22595 length:318 start_codon:yes stop_codon:yes gene_type:complete
MQVSTILGIRRSHENEVYSRLNRLAPSERGCLVLAQFLFDEASASAEEQDLSSINAIFDMIISAQCKINLKSHDRPKCTQFFGGNIPPIAPKYAFFWTRVLLPAS